MAALDKNTLPLFPGTFKSVDSRPDGRDPSILFDVYHCTCGWVFSDSLHATLGAHWWRCPKCNSDTCFQPVGT